LENHAIRTSSRFIVHRNGDDRRFDLRDHAGVDAISFRLPDLFRGRHDGLAQSRRRRDRFGDERGAVSMDFFLSNIGIRRSSFFLTVFF
jgi:hypothetical protein